MQPLVSIIIPTFNRAKYIGETLDSILAQTYRNWECLVVDDGSTDNTEIIMERYSSKDNRFQYHHRPKEKPKGANACRNYGFMRSKGAFINWFDSDDIMLPTNIEEKMKAFNDSIDMVIGNSVNFDEDGAESRPYPLHYEIPITAENFIGQRIGWITNDVLIRRSAVTIEFNEKLASGQEYNFFSRLLFKTNKAVYTKSDLVRRRVHSGSIQENLTTDSQNRVMQWYHNELFLLHDIREDAPPSIVNRSLRRLIRFSYRLSEPFSLNARNKEVSRLLKNNKKICSFLLYQCWGVSNLLFGKGYYFVKLAGKKV